MSVASVRTMTRLAVKANWRQIGAYWPRPAHAMAGAMTFWQCAVSFRPAFLV
jgi:hypothetical protein